MPKKQKIDNRLNKLFKDIQPEETPSKPKRTKVTREAPAPESPTPPSPDLKPVSASPKPGPIPRPVTRQTPTLPAAAMARQDTSIRAGVTSLELNFQAGQQEWATLQIVDEASRRTWTQDEQMLVRQVTDQLSLALENAHLFQETQYRADELATRAAHLKAVSEISTVISTILDLHELLQSTVDLIRQRFNFYHCHIFILKEDLKTLDVEACGWEEGDSHTGTHGTREIDINQQVSLVARAARTRKPVIDNDVSTDPGWLANPYLPRVKSEMAIPVVSGDRLLGVLNVHSDQLDFFTEEDALIQTTLAAQIAGAIENAHLFQEVQQLNQAIQSSNDSILTTDIDGRILQVNPAFTRMSGYAAQDAIGRTPRILSSGVHSREFYKQMWATILAGEIWHTEITNKRKNGSLYTVDQTILPVRDNQGTLTGFLALERDITESKEAQEALAKSEADLRALFAGMEDVVLVVDKDTRYVRIAPTNPSRLFRPPNELLGQRMDEILPPETHGPFKKAIHQALSTGETVQIEYELPVGGQTYWFLANISRLSEDQVFWVARDITERKKAEENLTRFKLGIENSGDAIFMTDVDGTIIYANSAFEKVYGYKPEEVIGKNPRIIKSGLIAQEQYEQFWGALLSKQTVTGELVNKTKDGQLKSIAGTNSPILDAKENILGFLAVHHDITDRKLAEEALQKHNNYLAASAEIGRLVTSTLDLNTIFTRTVNLINERFGFYHAAIFTVEETGFNAVLREGTGKAGAEMKQRKHRLALDTRSIVGKVSLEGNAVVVNNTAIDPVHKPNPLLPDTRAEAAIPMRVGNRIIGAIDIQSNVVDAFAKDEIAVLQTLADQVAIAIDNARSYELSQQAVMEMREIDRLKSQFLANMSHELRTPLNSIIGFSRVILKGIDGPVTELQQQDLTAIYNSGQHLLGLINDILDLSKIEAGKMELAFDEVNMADVTNSVLSTMTGLIKDKPIMLKRIIQPDLPPVRADAIRIRQVMINLLSNAAKFTDEGDIVIEVGIKPNASGRPELMVSVTDSGPGIDPKDQGKLFQAFSQVDDSPTRRTGGSGLGLSISQHLVQMHGGAIGVDSAVGRGSTFYFTLPLYHKEKEVDISNGGKVILAIDDDPQVIGLYERYLHPQGYQVIPLTDPSRAVDRARQLKPFAITLDIMMPGIDGWQVLNSLKSDAETREIPVIICSIIEDQEKGFSLGAADYLVKPILEEDLVNTLDRLNADGSIREVLVIDDNPSDLRLIGKMLNDDGRYKPILAEGGIKGWEIISSKSPPHAVILDLFMPGMDGFNILENMRSDKKLCDIPVIVISGMELTAEQKEQLSEFGQRLLTKGMFNEKELFTTIQRSLQRMPNK